MSGRIDQSQVRILIGSYGSAQETALTDPSILHRVREYRRSLSGRMVSLDKTGIKKKIPAGTFHVSRKTDGEFCVLIKEDDSVFTINPGGTIRLGLPFMDEAAAFFEKNGIGQAMIAGELYFRRPDEKRARVHDVVKVARKPETEDEISRLCFAVFDILTIEGETPAHDTALIRKKVEDLFSEGERIHPVEGFFTDKIETVFETFEKWVEEEGGEGLVLRSDTAGLYKIKPRHTLDLAVVGFTEGTGDRAGMIHDLLVAVMRKEGTFHLLGRVGGGFSEEERRNFLSDLEDMVVESEYHEISSDRVAYRMVDPRWVIEISCLDLISRNTRDAPMNRMVLSWNAEEKRYETVGPMPLASMISPQFIRLREDKTVCPEDIRMEQLTDMVDIPLADKNALSITFPKSKLVRRKVAAKVLKGETMVRKLLLWKTNKETEADRYPAYVICSTDFSPNRKTPLNRDIRVSNAEEQICSLWAELEKKAFVKGWEIVSDETAEAPPEKKESRRS